MPSLFDANVAGAGEQSLPAAAHWMEAVLSGPFATAVAVIAVALVGYGMLSGRVSAKRAFGVVLGCFILFGSASIGQRLTEAAGQLNGPAAPSVVFAQPDGSPQRNPRPTTANAFNPYPGNAPPR